MQETVTTPSSPLGVVVDRRSELRRAADANTTWSGILVALLILAGAALGATAGAASVGRAVDGTGPGVFGMLLGGFLGFVVGMVVFAQRRLESQVALRMERYFVERER